MTTRFGHGILAALILALASIPSAVLAADAETKKDEKSAAAAKVDKEKKDAEAKDEKILVIRGGDIQTVTQGVIREGTIVIRDGKIDEIGTDIEVPDGATVIDATGKRLTPGFVALNVSRLGLARSTTSLQDSLNPFDRNMKLALGVGITTAAVQTSGGSSRFPFSPADAAKTNGDFGKADNLIAGEPDIAIGVPSEEMNLGFIGDNRFVGLDPDTTMILQNATQATLDFGTFASVCPCCGIAIRPTEPIKDPKPQPAKPTSSAVVKMSFGSLDRMFVKSNPFYSLPRGSLRTALAKDTWRKQFKTAREYLKKKAEHEAATKAGKKTAPPRKPVTDDFLALMEGKKPMRMSAPTASEIRDMIALADELGYKVSFDQTVEAWLVADELSKAGATVTITPRASRRPNFGEEDSSGSWVETPRVLEESGIPFAVTALSPSISLGGIAGRDLTSLPLEAAFLVRGGASSQEALEALTISPAKMLGIEDRVGSLEAGKDADILILTGDPLDYRTYVETAIVNGRVAYERAKDRVLPQTD
ncbi:MAG: amidohydrolase family protein [Planctomycetota bacterium]